MTVDYLRRCTQGRRTAVEEAIHRVIGDIEKMPADVRLSLAQSYLYRAQMLVADYVDGVDLPAPAPGLSQEKAAHA